MEETKSFKTPKETFNALLELFKANDRLIEKGKVPVSISIIGDHGIGKTTVCEEAVLASGKNFYKLSLAQYTEPAELQGYKQRETLVTKEGENAWVPENLIPAFINSGYKYSGKVRTIDCPPEWVTSLEDNTVILLDDFSRGNQLLMQAIMELVNTQEMVGWSLKGKGIQILLNENPDGANYNVAGLDDAQIDRKGEIYMKWCPKSWAEWAEKGGVDGKLINFVLWKPELFQKSELVSSSGAASPRMMDKFFSLIGLCDDLTKNMDKITLFGEMTVGRNIVHQLQEFIKGDLDKLPTSEDLIKNDTLEVAKKKLTEVCGNSNKPKTWKAATASIIAIRLFNYIKLNVDKLEEKHVIRYKELAQTDSFGADSQYHMLTYILSSLGDLSSVFFEDDDNSIPELVYS